MNTQIIARLVKVSIANLQLVKEGNTEVLNSHPRLRTLVRDYGVEAILACIDVAICTKTGTITTALTIVSDLSEEQAITSVVVCEEIEEVVEKAAAKLIPFKLTERSEIEAANAVAFKLFKSVVTWAQLVPFVMSNFDSTYDVILKNTARSIKAKMNKLDKKLLNSTYLTIKEVVGELEASMFVTAVKTCQSIIPYVKGSFERQSSIISVGVVSTGVVVELDDFELRGMHKTSSIMLTPAHFSIEHAQKMSRVSISDQNGYKVKFNSFLEKSALLMKNNISVEAMDREDIYLQLVLSCDGSKTKLTPVSQPGSKLSDYAINSAGFIEPSKAEDGFLSFYPNGNANYPGLAEYNNGIFNSICDGKKFAARQEKLNKDRKDAFKVTLKDVFLVKEVPEHMLDVFNTGCLYLGMTDLLTYGVCRMVSNIHNAMLKGATHLATVLDSQLGKTHSFLAASSFKGGLYGALKAAGMSPSLTEEITTPEGFWEDLTLSNGTVIQVRKVEIEVMITNPYTVHSYTQKGKQEDASTVAEMDLENLEDLLDSYESQEDSKALAFEVLEEAQQSGSIVKAIQNTPNFKRKLPLTTIVSSDIAIVRNSYGEEEATKLIKSLLKDKLNAPSKKRKYAVDILKGEYNVIKSVELLDLLNVVGELAELYQVSLLNSQFTTCNRNFLLLLVEWLGANTTEHGWVEIKYNDQTTHLPVGTTLYGDLISTSHTIDKVVTTGILGKILKHLASCFKFKELSFGIVEQLFTSLHLETQWVVINKDFGRLKSIGKYFTLLPGTWLENKYDVCLPGRDLYVPKASKKKFVGANICKQPDIFDGSYAGCHVYKDIPNFFLDEELREVLSCVAFVHPDYLLELQND